MYSKQHTRLTPVLFCVSSGRLGIDHFLNSFWGEMAKYKGLPFLLQDNLDSLLMTVNVVHVNETYTSISYEVSRLSRDCYIKLLCSNINTKEMCHTWVVLSWEQQLSVLLLVYVSHIFLALTTDVRQSSLPVIISMNFHEKVSRGFKLVRF